MLKNYFIIAIRNLWKNKGFSVINITGLAIGMAATILILLWIQDEVSYDQFHKNKDRIYQVWNRVPFNGKIRCWNSCSALLKPVLEKDLPEIELAARWEHNGNMLVTAGEKKLMKEGAMADTSFLQIFTFPMLAGNPSTALNNKYSVVLTEKTARSLFGNTDAMGKTIKIGDNDNFTVTGILKDLPANTAFNFDYLLPWSALEQTMDLGWGDNNIPTYVLLKKNADFTAVNAKIKWLKQQYDDEAKTENWELFLYPLSHWHLHAKFTDGVEDNGDRSTFVQLFGIIAGFILLIACINFMNLSTAQSEKRAKEIGIRKTVGALRGELIGQFIGESVFIAFLAGVTALIIVQISLPGYNQVIDKQLSVNYYNVYTWLAFVAFILFVGLLAGSYPAFFLSSFQPGKVLKGTFKKANALLTPRKVLVVSQFTFAIILIICTIIIKRQIDYANNRNTGYNKDNLVYHFTNNDLRRNYPLIKNELIRSGIANSVTQTNSPLTERWSNGWGQDWEGKDPNDNTNFDRYLEDESLGVTAGLQFIQGRDLDLRKFPTDSTGVVINESALKVMKFKDPIGKQVRDLGVTWHIVGVIKDFILTSPYEPTRPILICGAKSRYMSFNTMLVKLNGNNANAKNMEKMAAIFKKYNPEYPFDPKFVDEEYAKKFNNEKREGILAGLFAALTIFISCLGLFGLATYMAENRIKEIGVRKVLGASVIGITSLLSKDFIKLVGIAFLIAAPLAWTAMHKWLQTYTYRVEIEWWVFALAGFLSVTIALLTVGYQAVRAAIANPVKSLRTE